MVSLNLPSIGQSGWGDEVLDSLNALNSGKLDTTTAAATYIAAGTQAPSALGTVIGNNASPNDMTYSAFMASAQISNPNAPYMGALNGFVFYNGTQGGSAGSLQGGSTSVQASMSGTVSQAVLSFEALVHANSSGTFNGEVLSFKSTAYASDTATVSNLTGIWAAGPYSNGGTPTVTNAHSIRATEPTIGTNRYTYFGTGRHRFVKGTHANAVEIVDAGNTLQWANNGTVWKGFASDGSSERVVLDPSDGATTRVLARTLGSGNAFQATNFGSETFRVATNGTVAVMTTAGLRNLEVGAADSAGTGYRTVRVSN